MSKPSKIVLAYSGGLDTTVILCWLREQYDCEVIPYLADLGQGEETGPAVATAKKLGFDNVVVEDLRDTFVTDYVWPMLRANAKYEGAYLLGTSIARPLIAARQVAVAQQQGADAVAHGATGKGNDQVRFELGYLGLAPDLQVIAPWRIWDLNSRTRLLAYAAEHGIDVAAKRADGAAPYSMDANLLHISYEGGELENPATKPPADMWLRTVAPEDAPATPQQVEIEFVAGDPVSVDGEQLVGAAMLTRLNELAGAHGIGRADLVESRFVGMKSRGCYETPGGTLLLHTRRALEAITLDREIIRLRDDLMPRYATAVYNGFWFSPERELLQELIDSSSQPVTGTVTVELYKGNISICGRSAAGSLFDESIATFEDDGGSYQQSDAHGFIRLNALRLQMSRRRKQGNSSD